MSAELSPAITGLVTPAAIGYILQGFLAPGQGAPGSLALRLSLSWGLGMGAVSILFFFWIVAAGSPAGYLWAETFVLLGLLAAHLKRRDKGSSGEAAQTPAPPTESRFAYIAAAVFIISSVVGCYVFLANINFLPHGRWDAWMIWTLRAKALVYYNEQWRLAFDPAMGWTHSEYPFLLPGSIARIWSVYATSQPWYVPVAIAALYTASLAGLMVSLVYVMRGPALAYSAGAVLLASPMVYLQGSSLYADIPLAFYFLASLGVGAAAMERPKSPAGLWALSGFLAGLALWTKSEGQVFAVAVLVAVGAASWFHSGRTAAAGRVWRMALGMALPLAALALFKMNTTASAYMLRGATMEALLQKLADPERYFIVFVGFAYEIFNYPGFYLGGVPVAAPALAVLFLLAWGIDKGSFRREAWITGAAVLAVMMAGYCAAYLVTPMDLQWQFNTSAVRLLTQVWPIFVMLVFMAMDGRTPEPNEGGKDDGEI